MHPVRTLGAACGVAAIVLGGASGAVAAHAAGHRPTSSAADAPRWQTSGRWIVDEHGRVVITQGVNEVQKSPPYAPDGAGFGEKDAQLLQREGYTSVRLGVYWNALEKQPGTYDDAYLARLRGTVQTLQRHGISTLLDFHQDMANPKYQGLGWPDWAVLDDGLPNDATYGFPANYFSSKALQRVYDNFLADKPAPDGVGVATHYARAIGHTAAYFKDAKGVFGIDLYNEPWPGSDFLPCVSSNGCPTQDAALAAVQQKAIDVVRHVDPHTTVYYEPQVTFNLGFPTHVRQRGNNLGMSFHVYCASFDQTGTYAGCSEPDGRAFDNADRHAADTGHGLLLTEYGATEDRGALAGVTDLAARHRVGTMLWAYNETDTASLEYVAVPHPDRVSGTPLSYGFDRAAGRFTMKYSPRRVGGGSFGAGSSTTILIPASDAPHGYDVRVTGAHVRSAPNARELVLSLAPGASMVDVTVTARRTSPTSSAPPSATVSGPPVATDGPVQPTYDNGDVVALTTALGAGGLGAVVVAARRGRRARHSATD
ncbi:cellulase family glycosylhydrolase [Luteipulveratus mongoliensis]|uniref:cellulase family glycosylhydrolase n=1 Tax=Luteipulveratus mongoliensis TaxID=571913 RepID=UPI000698DE46|nr:cellulase family glycosylhydrolase [Luteipulveratus mongoliensis]